MPNFKDWDYYEFLTFVIVLFIFGLVYSLLFLGYRANTQFSATYKMYLTCRTEAIRAKNTQNIDSLCGPVPQRNMFE
jgi:hypothetical protein